MGSRDQDHQSRGHSSTRGCNDNQEGTIKELIGKIKNRKTALEIGNEQGNTPLHFAASLGSVAMCKIIVEAVQEAGPKAVPEAVPEADPKAVPPALCIRNKKGETPLFVAALHGKKGPFLYLQERFGKAGPRRFNGDTILHCAIAGEYFDLALLIIHRYEDLVDTVNGQGLSALHLLASKPSAFRSGRNLTGYSEFIYRCIFVDNVKLEGSDDESKDHKDGNYPDNYETCIQFFQLLLKVVRCGKEKVKEKTYEEALEGQGIKKNEENPGDQGACIPWIRIEEGEESHGDQGHRVFPATYDTCFELLKLAAKALLTLLGRGYSGIRTIRDEKRKHNLAVQIVDKILGLTSTYQDNTTGRSPEPEASDIKDEISASNLHDIVEVGESGGGDNKGKEKEEDTKETMRETPILLAARHGVVEIVKRILEHFPIAIHDTNVDNKNIALLAAEYRQPHIFKYLLERDMLGDNVLGTIDKDGNSALHLAAKLEKDRPWHIPGAALQMQWEYKWYEYVRECMPAHFNFNNNNEETPQDVFQSTHNQLVKEGAQWLREASNSCSVVAALVAGVAFATSATFPGGFNDKTEAPNLVNHPAFSVFSLASLVALCFSVTALIMFLAIITSRNEEKDFGKELPGKLLIGLSSLFLSIASMLASFCAGHFFVLQNELKFAALPVYAVACLPASLFAVAHFPLFFDLVRAIFRKVPQRSLNLIRL